MYQTFMSVCFFAAISMVVVGLASMIILYPVVIVLRAERSAGFNDFLLETFGRWSPWLPQNSAEKWRFRLTLIGFLGLGLGFACGEF